MRARLLLPMLLLCTAALCEEEDPDLPTDADGDSYTVDVDCDDEDPAVHPNATEVCNDFDDNCDGITDEGVDQLFWADADNDGFGDQWDEIRACNPSGSVVSNSFDCDDTDGLVNPDADEVCDDGIDNDCDELVDTDDTDCPM